MRIVRHPTIDLTAALEDTPPSPATLRKAATLTVTGGPDIWTVGGHHVHLGRNQGLCDCEAAQHGRVCSHLLAVVAHTGWTPPERPEITVGADPFEGLV